MEKLKLIIGLIIYKLAPIKRNRYVFTSFEGHYSDNTKYISIKLHELDKAAEIIWLVRPEYQNEVPEYVKCVEYNSMKAYWYRGTATAQIDNVYGFRAVFKTTDSIKSNLKIKIFSFLTNKKRQPVFATMHGTTLKKIGRDQIGNTVLDMSCPNSYLLVGDSLSAEVYRRVTFGKIKTEALGWSRNDILFCKTQEIRDKLKLPVDKKIVLFAPTFRNDGKDVEGKNVYRSGLNQLEEMDFSCLFESLSNKFGGEWVMVCRFHYHVAELVKWEELEKQYPGKIINGNKFDDMAEYLACTDILITDASSCMCDFSFTNKPCFLYFPDLDNYRTKERGLYIEIEDLPYPLATDFATLIDNIRDFDQADYEENIGRFLSSIGSIRDGKASERIVRYILNAINS